MGNIVERVFNNSSEINNLLMEAMLKLHALKEKVEADIKDARREVFWLLKIQQKQQALHYVEHVYEAEDVHYFTLVMQGYCALMMKAIKNLDSQRPTSNEVKEAKAGFHFMATRCKELSCLHHIDQALIMKVGIEPWYQYLVDPHIARKLRMMTEIISVEKREQLLKEIAIERGLLSSDVGAGSPEIVESCKICSMTQAQKPEPDEPPLLSYMERHEATNLFMNS